jgi:hypothetical protein
MNKTLFSLTLGKKTASNHNLSSALVNLPDFEAVTYILGAENKVC